MQKNEKYKTLKISLKTILKPVLDSNFYLSFNVKLLKANEISFLVSSFIRDFTINGHYFQNNQDIVLDKDFIKMAFITLCKNFMIKVDTHGMEYEYKRSSEAKLGISNLKISNSMKDYFSTNFKQNFPNFNPDFDDNYYKVDGTNLSHIYGSLISEFETSYTNHIRFNWVKYVNQYINEICIESNFVRLSIKEFKKLSPIDQEIYNDNREIESDRIKKIKTELLPIKNFIYNNNKFEDKSEIESKYFELIDNILSLLPKLPEGMKNYANYVDIQPFKFLRSLLILSADLEQKDKKIFQSIPIHKKLKNRHIPFDTSAIMHIFNVKNFNLKTNKEIWEECFNVYTNKSKLTGYSFDYNITTDGKAVSLRFIKNDQKEFQELSLQLNAEARKKTTIFSDILINSKIKLQLGKNYFEILYKQNEVKGIFKKFIKDFEIIKKEITKICTDEKKNTKKDIKNKIKVTKKVEEAERIEKAREDFKNLPKDKQHEIKAKMKAKKTGFEYIEDVVKSKINFETIKDAYLKGSIKVCDPGMRDLLTIYGTGKQFHKNKISKINQINMRIKKNTRCKNGFQVKKSENFFDLKKDTHLHGHIELKNKVPTGNIIYSYRNKRRLRETKRLKNSKIINKLKNNINFEGKSISKIETELSKFSCKSVNPLIFSNYLKIKLKLFYNLQQEKTYINKLNQLGWFSFIDTKRHEDNILNEIRGIYGEDSIFILGDWSKSNCIKYISTPNTKMAKLLSKIFKVYLIDEFKTSKLYNKNSKIESKKLSVKIKYKDKKSKKEVVYNKKIHAVLKFQTDKKTSNCVNRDYNAVLNMKNIVNQLMINKKRPLDFCRENLQKVKKITKKSLRPLSKLEDKLGVGETDSKEILNLSSPYLGEF